MEFQNMLNTLIPVIGQEAVNKLAKKLDDLAADEGDAFQALLLSLVSDSVEAHGPAGVEIARQAVEAMFEGETPSIDWASPRTASDIVAMMQNAEAGRRSRTRKFFAKLGDALSLILVGLIKGLAAS